MSIMSPESSASKPKSPKEIERKFLVTFLPEDIYLTQMDGEEITQGYLAWGSGGTVRIRRLGEAYFWTVKQKVGNNPVERDEHEVEISEAQFNKMWPATEGRRVEKTRYRIPYLDAEIELDVFDSGHMLAEVEFPSLGAAESFTPPDWLGPDVTDDGRFGNAHIARKGFPFKGILH